MRSVRLFYKKFGNMKFVSHLDMNRFMIRMVRMSGIPVWYSEGFNPHPYITFALPLSLGFDSEYEVMDIRLDDDLYDNTLVYTKLKSLMPEGIEFFGVGDPMMKAGDVAFASFKLEFDNLKCFEAQLIEFLNSDTIIAEKKTKKGKMKEIDLKEFIKSFDVCDNTVELILAAGGSNNLNPKLLIDTFADKYNLQLPPYSVSRTMLYNESLQEFK
jgi:radical SAM-linked protein